MGASSRGSVTKEGLGVQKHRAYSRLGELSTWGKPHTCVKGMMGMKPAGRSGHQIPG